MSTRPAHLHRAPLSRSRAQAQSRLWHVVSRLEMSPEARCIDELLSQAERHLERAQKLIRDAECGVVPLRRRTP